MLRFTGFRKHKQGIIALLLRQSYREYFRHDPNCELIWKKSWEEYDRAVFTHPDTIGACGFVTTLSAQVVGFASWDPRQFPVGVIGHNCILPEFRGNSYGTQQTREVLRILRSKGVVKVEVTTGEHEFFNPARRMYQACGFRETARGPGDECSDYGTVTYEISIEPEEDRSDPGQVS